MGKGAKHTRRLFRTLIGVVLFAAVLLFVAGMVFMIPSVQTKAAKKTAAILSEKLQTGISIEKLRLYWNLDFRVEGLRIEDRHRQPMFAVGSLKGRLPHHNRSKRSWRFSGMEADSLLVYNAKYQGEEENNMKFLFAFFASDKEKKPVRLLFENVRLKNGTYIWYNEQRCKEDVDGVWNYDHIRLKRINAEIAGITVDNGECHLEISHLDCDEHSGFTIRNMQTLLTVSGQKLYLENTTFDAIGGSHIDMDFRFDFDNWHQYAAFQDSVLFRCQLRPSMLHATDLTYFSPALQGIEPISAQLQGKVENSLSHLEIKQFSCYLNDSTHLKGNIFTEGIQHGRTARWDAEIDELAVVMRKLDGWHLPGGKPLNIPEPLKKLVVHEGEADFHGTLDDFSTDVELSGNLGGLRVYGTCSSEKGNRRYNARLQTRSLQLQELLHSPLLGQLTTQGEISGNAANLEDYRLNIQSLHFHGREIRNARLQGDMEDGRLTFKLHSPDSALLADINGFVDFREEKIYYAGELNRFDLSAFRFLPEDSNAILSLHSQADLTGSFSQGLYGVVKVNSASLTENGNRVRIPPFQLLSDTAENGDMELKLRSTPLQASLSGKLRLADLPHCLERLAQKYLPHSLGRETAQVPENTTFDLSVTMKQSIQLMERLLPQLHLGGGFILDAHYAEQDGAWRMQAEIPSIGWQQIRLEKCRIQSDNEAESLRLAADCRQLYWNSSDSLSHLDNLQLQMDCADDTARFRLHNQPDGAMQPPYIDLRGTMRFERFEECILQLQQGILCLHQEPFDIGPGSEIILEKNSIKVNRFQMDAGTQSVALEGTHSRGQASRLAFRTRNLHLSELESLLLPYGLSIDGIATGELNLANRNDRLQLTTQMTIDSLVFNDVAYGQLQSDAYWQEEGKQIQLQAKLFPLQEAAPAIHLHGNYKPETKQIDLQGVIRTFNLHTIAPYLSSFATSVEGTASGQLHMTGLLRKPSLSGNLHINDAFMKIGYINTQYHIQNQNIGIIDSAFMLQNVQCTDIQGHPAYMDGKITHRQLKQWGVRLDIRTQNTMVLNTDYRDNDLFYGKAFGTGTVRLRLRSQGDFYVSGDLKTDRQTYISVLLNKGASIQKQQSYIVFEKPFSSTDETGTITSAPAKTTRTRLNFNLDITPDATLKVVLDPSIGGTIIGNGSGAIRMELQPERPFEMYGSYTLNEGTVDLAIGNVFTRTLSIENGSSLNWNGQPDKGEMNVRAVYETKASITSLLGESSVTSSYRSVPVSTGLRLKGELLNPEFDFDIRLDNVDESIRSMVYNTLDTTDKDNMFRQAFSLMLLGRFDVQNPEGENDVDYGGLGHSLSELFSHYLQKTVSTLTDKVNVGFNYRPGNGATNGDEYNIQLSTNLMENRLVIRGSLDIYGDNNEQNDRQAVAGNVVGDVIVEYKITSDGSLRIKAFNMANYYDVLSAAYSDVPYYQGIGFSFTKDFDNLKGLFSRKRK